MVQGFFVMALALGAAGPQQEQAWFHHYGKALSAAKKSGYPLLVVLEVKKDSHETEKGNGSSEKFTSTTPGASTAKLGVSTVKSGASTADTANEELLKYYVRCRIDVSTPYGKRVAKSFGASQFPHVAIIDKTGRYILKRMTGPVSREKWQTTLTAYQRGILPARRTTVQQPSYQQPTYMQSQSYSSPFIPSFGGGQWGFGGGAGGCSS